MGLTALSKYLRYTVLRNYNYTETRGCRKIILKKILVKLFHVLTSSTHDLSRECNIFNETCTWKIFPC